MTFEHVTPEWLNDKLKEHSKGPAKITGRSLAIELGLNERTVSMWKNGMPIGSTAQALLHYYFTNLECQKLKK